MIKITKIEWEYFSVETLLLVVLKIWEWSSEVWKSMEKMSMMSSEIVEKGKMLSFRFEYDYHDNKVILRHSFDEIRNILLK